jgi:signal transduction histidine kinase
MRSFSLQERLEIKPCRLEEIVARIALNFEIEFRQRKVSFRTRIAPETEALVDENAVTQVFTNLIKNSLEAMEGVSKGTIWISAEEIDPFYLKVVYLNDGPLIPPEILEKIFTPLFSTKESGRGIGLPLCQKLLTSMGGTIKAVAPRSGYGAEFHLFLPQKRYHL